MRVARLDELAIGGYRLVDAGATSIAVFRLADGCCAIEDMCTHDGGALAGGAVIGDRIECVRHGARFCLRTGKAVLGPAFAPVRTFPVRVKNGWIEVAVTVSSG